MSAYVIAEAGVNHNGEFDLACQLIDIAADAGADAVKFQTFVPEEVISRFAPKAEYQLSTTDAAESQLEMARNLRLRDEDFFTLAKRCAERGIRFLSTPFNLSSIDFLAGEMKLDTLKLPSGEVTNGPFLLRAARTGCDIILSTGMATTDEVREALGVLAHGFTHTDNPASRDVFGAAFDSEQGQGALRDKVTLLHCTTEYPTPFEAVNLRAIDTLREVFGLPVGFSDHTPGITAAIAAVARGAHIVEKHFTLDKALPGPDHKASLDPAKLNALVAALRDVDLALGDGVKQPQPAEIKNMPIARKSLIAQRAIRAGEPFSEENLTVKRPGTGLSPMTYWDWIGQAAPRDFSEDEIITEAE